MREWARVLKPGGRLITVDFQTAPSWARPLLRALARGASWLERHQPRQERPKVELAPRKRALRDQVSRSRPMRHPTADAVSGLMRSVGLTRVHELSDRGLVWSDLRTRPPSWWFPTERRFILSATKAGQAQE